MKLHLINAEEGDCLLVESGDATPRFVLVDGGPAGVYERFARDHLRQVIGAAGTIDLAVLSHVDADHVVGLLDLLADIEAGRANDEQTLTVTDLWHNSFAEAVDTPAQDISQGIQTLLDVAGTEKMALSLGQTVFYGIGQGARLARSALRLGMSLNGAFGGELISPDTLASPLHSVGDLEIRVIGPTDANLRELQREWLEWLAARAQALADEGPSALANADKSIPNLSSIILQVSEGGRRMLLTGDARGDHILQGLSEAGLLDAQGKAHFDLLKVQHHGSVRNANRSFFESVTADRYAISANGKHGNPDLETLEWIVAAAANAASPVDILVTNEAPTLAQLRARHPPALSNYRLVVGADPAQLITF